MIGIRKIRMVLCAVAFALVFSLMATDSASAVSFDSVASAQNKINNAIIQQKNTVTFYTKKRYNSRALFFNAAISTNVGGTQLIAEKQAYRGDYNKHALLRSFKAKQYLVRKKGKPSYYKYKYTMTYKTTKARSNYINKVSRRLGKAYRKGTAFQRSSWICNWIARNTSYKITNKPTIYESLTTKKGQCFHYAVTFYKIAKEAGLEVRLVTGTARSAPFQRSENHMWCIVKSGKKWYQVDPTWADEGNGISARWIMKGRNDFFFNMTHFPDAQSRAMMNRVCVLAN